jgi:hypothetical protein
VEEEGPSFAIQPTHPQVQAQPRAPEPGVADVEDDQELVLEDLTREQVLDWHNRATADHQLVFDHIDRHGELSAQRLFTRAFVAQVQRLSGLGYTDEAFT